MVKLRQAAVAAVCTFLCVVSCQIGATEAGHTQIRVSLTELHEAAQAGELERVQSLVEAGQAACSSRRLSHASRRECERAVVSGSGGTGEFVAFVAGLVVETLTFPQWVGLRCTRQHWLGTLTLQSIY